MKKFITMGLALVLATGVLTGCSTSQKADEVTTESKTETITVDYGQGLNADGTLADIDAADYVKVCDYSAVELASADVSVSDDEVQEQIDSFMENYKTTKQVTDREVKDGDVVNIDYVGTVNGEEFEGGNSDGQGYDLTIGSDTFIDGFEDQLIGHTPGETVEVNVTFPDDYTSEDLAGKDAVFKTTIHYISETEDQKLTDDFVKENLQDTYGYTSVKDMKKQIKKALKDNKETDAVWNYLVDKSEFQEIPDTLIEDRVDILVNALASNLSAQGYSLEEYLSVYGYEDEAALRESYHDSCENTVKVFLLADVIAGEKGLSVTEEAKKEYFQSEDYSSYTSFYSDAYVNRVVLDDMVVKMILETAKIK
ncbi:MAG: trigger factor [Lachnospiraceae bacterium]|nr:trigger factor [Lachnospiraceae bacterium]